MAGYVPLVMVRATLDDVSVPSLPAPYSLRWYRRGDELDWIALQGPFYEPGAVTRTLFREQFGGDEALLRERLCFVVDGEGETLGTVAAGLNGGFRSPEYGRVHWLAVHGAHQGQGLGKLLVGIALTRLQELGYTKVYLTTDAARPVAVNLYRRCGFEVADKDIGVRGTAPTH